MIKKYHDFSDSVRVSTLLYWTWWHLSSTIFLSVQFVFHPKILQLPLKT